MPPNPADNCKIRVAVRVRPFNRRGDDFMGLMTFFIFFVLRVVYDKKKEKKLFLGGLQSGIIDKNVFIWMPNDIQSCFKQNCLTLPKVCSLKTDGKEERPVEFPSNIISSFVLKFYLQKNLATLASSWDHSQRSDEILMQLKMPSQRQWGFAFCLCVRLLLWLQN